MDVEGELGDAVVNLGEVVGDLLGLEEMVSILTVGEVVAREIGAGHDDLIVNAVQLHVLEAPAFVDTSGYEFLAQASEVGSVIHAHFYSFRPKFGNQRGE